MSALDPIRNIPFEDQSIGLHQWLGIRKDAALKIDPETAEVHWSYGLTMDPYGVENNLPDDCKQVGRVWFARAPDSEIWVSFDDLPDAVVTALRQRRIVIGKSSDWPRCNLKSIILQVRKTQFAFQR